MSVLEDDRIEEVFNFFDKDGSGKLDNAELKTALQLLCIDVVDEELQEISASDGDADTLTLEEFKQIVHSDSITKINFQDRTMECFEEFAKEHDGMISRDTLMIILTQRGENPMPEDEAEELLNHFDADENGIFNIEELTRMMYHVHDVQSLETAEQETATGDA